MTSTTPVATDPAVTATTGAGRYFPTLNAVRAAGALMVVCTHAAFNTGKINDGWTGALLSRLDFGVTLFFVLSGFLLSRPFFLARAAGTPQPSVRHYFWKRALRILPLYWLVVVAALLLDPENRDATWQVWLGHLTFTQLYQDDLLASSLTQMWSLCTEVAFYLLLPPLCLLLTVSRRHRGLHLPTVLARGAALAALGVAWQARVAPIPGYRGHYAQWLPGYLPWFVVGLAFAAISADLAVRPRAHLLDRLGSDLLGCWVVGFAVFAVACSPVSGPRQLLAPGSWEAGSKTVLYAVAAAFLVLPLIFGPEREGPVRALLSGPVPNWLGDISYGIFAIHMLVLNAVFRVLDIEIFTGHFLVVLAATLAVTIALATASFHLYERRFLRLKELPRRRARARRSAA